MFRRLLLFFLAIAALQNSGFSQVDDTTFQEIDEVLISSEKKKDIAFEDPKFFIVDFTVSDTNAILLMRNFRTYYLYELDNLMNFRQKLRLKIDAGFLFEDCFGNTHVVSKDSVFLVLNDQQGLFLTESHPRRQFMNAMTKCVGSTSEKIVFEKMTNYYQDHTFYTVDIDSGDRNVVYEVKDSEIARSMREAAAKLYSMNYRSKSRMDGDNLRGRSRKIETNLAQDSKSQRAKNGKYDRRAFIASHVLRPKYNPLFSVDDTLYVFNHFEGKAEVISHRGEILKTVPIHYHLKSNWDKKVYVDKAKKVFYAVNNKSGVQQLIRLSFEEDQQNSSSEITKHAYPKKVLVRNGYAYYTYKPNFDANLNKLYRQKL